MLDKKKNFSWSWSRLKNFRTCPKRHWHVDIAKDFQEDPSEALTWGNQVHDAMAKRIMKGVAMPNTMQRYDDWPQRVLAMGSDGIKLKVENKLAMDEQFQPTGFFDNATWFRCVIDVLGLGTDEKTAFTIDWKTGGKVQPEFEQLALSAQVLFAHYPKLDEVLALYVWLGHDTQSPAVYKRGEMQKVWADVLPMVNKMKQAADTMTYPPNPSGLCINWCPVKSCPHHGVGTRR